MIKLNSKTKHLGMAVLDACFVLLAFYIAIYLRFEWQVPLYIISRLQALLLPAVLISLVVFYLFGIYKRIWRYAGLNDLVVVAAAVTVSILGAYIYSITQVFVGNASFIIAWFLLLFLVGGSRLLVRVIGNLLSNPRPKGRKSKALIVGAGEGGVLVARELKRNRPNLNLKVVGFIDDDSTKQKQVIQGIPVLGTRSELPAVVDKLQVDEVIIAMPSAPYSVLQEIVGLCEDLKVKIKTVPGIFEILEGQVNFKALKDVDIEDLLRRPPVEQDLLGVAAYLAGRTVMVTGAGGSIGSELCRQIARLGPEKLVLADHDENGIFYIHNELEINSPRVKTVPLVCDIKEKDALEAIFKEHRPHVVFHAAAHKHVPLMELNVKEAVRNNIEGSMNLIDLAAEHGVKRFVFISTDKAVNPTSVMGSTKRMVEIYLQQKERQCSSCIYCSVRFGNVLGSQGSVVLLFREQIERGGPVTVTHPEMKRYFMTIPEAVQLVIQAGSLGRGGEIFVLDMGEPIKILDLARDMIILSGLKPDRDIKIQYTGLRPGEKLYEELFSARENFAVTRHERIFIAPDTNRDTVEIETELVQLGERLGPGSNLSELLDFKIESDISRQQIGADNLNGVHKKRKEA